MPEEIQQYIPVNIVKLASNLAHNATVDELVVCSSDSNYIEENDLYNGENYKESVQKVFDRWYDYFYDEILKTEKPKETSYKNMSLKDLVIEWKNMYGENFIAEYNGLYKKLKEKYYK